MKYDCLVVGQGICGTFLARGLEKAGLSFLVIDEANPGAASRAAAGVINPVTGRRIVKTWLIEEILPFARNAYEEMGRLLDISCISQKNILDFFPTPQMRLAFLKRLETDPQWIGIPPDTGAWKSWLRDDFGMGEINSSLLVDLHALLPAFRRRLDASGRLLEEKFLHDALVLSGKGIEYGEHRADRIIFCDGIAAVENPYFSKLPFAPNKGEALLAEIEGLPAGHIYKRGLSLVPWEGNIFWVGSSYEWQFSDPAPSQSFRQRAESLLKEWLSCPFRIVDHWASIRPATLERRPFVGFHPDHPSVGILNGMGTKGCSLAPYFAAQLSNQIAGQGSILPEADIKRYAGMFRR